MSSATGDFWTWAEARLDPGPSLDPDKLWQMVFLHLAVFSFLAGLIAGIQCLLLVLFEWSLERAIDLICNLFRCLLAYFPAGSRALELYYVATIDMDDLAAKCVASLTSHEPVETKQQHLLVLKQEIKHRQCPESAIALCFHAVKIALDTPHLMEPGFSIFNHLTKRLKLQEHYKPYRTQFKLLHRELMKRLGDPKERIRQKAVRALADAWSMSSELRQDVHEMVILQLQAKCNPRCKESLMSFILDQHREHKMAFRRFIPFLVACCEDSDGDLRLKSQTTLIQLFQHTPDASIKDLNHELLNYAVRPSIVDHVLSEISARRPDAKVVPVSRAGTPKLSASVPPQTSKAVVSNPPTRVNTPKLSASVHQAKVSTSKELDTPIDVVAPPMSVAEQEAVELDALDFRNGDELEECINEMLPLFEGRESEANWNPREKRVLKLRRIVRGNAISTFAPRFRTGLKSMVEGILKTVDSLRTTVCVLGCHLVQDLAKNCANLLDQPAIADMLQHLVKLTGNSKTIAAQKAAETVLVMMKHILLPVQMLKYTEIGMQSKIPFARISACNWLGLIIENHSSGRARVTSPDSQSLIQTIVAKALHDSNAGVREEMRPTYWKFARIWADRSEKIINDLNATQRDLLINHNANPCRPAEASDEPAKTITIPGLSKSALTLSKRPSIKDTINANRKAKAEAEKAKPTKQIAGMEKGKPTKSTPAPEPIISEPEKGEARPATSGFGAAPVRLRRQNTDVSGRTNDNVSANETSINELTRHDLEKNDNPVDLDTTQADNDLMTQVTAEVTAKPPTLDAVGSNENTSKQECAGMNDEQETIGTSDNPNQSLSISDMVNTEPVWASDEHYAPVAEAPLVDVEGLVGLQEMNLPIQPEVDLMDLSPMRPLPAAPEIDLRLFSPPDTASPLPFGARLAQELVNPRTRRTYRRQGPTLDMSTEESRKVQQMAEEENLALYKEALETSRISPLPTPAKCTTIFDNIVLKINLEEYITDFEWRDFIQLWPGIPAIVWSDKRQFDSLIQALLTELSYPATVRPQNGSMDLSSLVHCLEVVENLLAFQTQHFMRDNNFWLEQTLVQVLLTYNYIGSPTEFSRERQKLFRTLESARRRLLACCDANHVFEALMEGYNEKMRPVTLRALLASVHDVLWRITTKQIVGPEAIRKAVTLSESAYTSEDHELKLESLRLMQMLHDVFDDERIFWGLIQGKGSLSWRMSLATHFGGPPASTLSLPS